MIRIQIELYQIGYRYIHRSAVPVLWIRDVLSRIPDPDPDPTIAQSRIRGVKKHRIPDPQRTVLFQQ
jgi:hypothetical protein